MDRSTGRYCFLFLFGNEKGVFLFFLFLWVGKRKDECVIGEAAEVTEATPITVGDRARGNQGSRIQTCSSCGRGRA